MMKKIVWISGIVVVVLGSLLFLIPVQKQFNSSVKAECPSAAITRLMTQQNKWDQWWPGEKNIDSSFTFNGTTYKPQTILLNGFTAIATNETGSYLVDLQFLSGPNSTSQLFLTSTLQFSSNPFTRLLQFTNAWNNRQRYTELLGGIASSFNDVKKVYGFKIVEERVPNASHIAMKKMLDHYPSTQDIYALVDELRQYVVANGAAVVNTPILNIFTADDKEWQLMVALATNKDLPSTDKYLLKKMVLGKIIIGEGMGPQSTVDSLQQQVEFFVKDHGKSSPAIQFQRLLTDRRTTDSSQWVTTVNYPVFDRAFF